MFSTSTFLTVALLVAPAIQGVLADFAISSPALVQCKPARISWESTKGPYNLIVVNAADPCGDALVEIGDFNQTFVDWTAKVKAGTKVQLSLVDADDNEAWSKDITVGPNTDVSCLQSVVTTGSAASTGASATGTTTGTPIATTSAPSTPTTSADTTYDSSSSDSGVAPIGAANAGTLQDNAAFTVRQASTPLMVISGLAAVFTLSL
ncbi:hypothetical protein BDN70DRAFT_883769 [Pholiota conissans]|uniref:Uncharacterized protein n=1 Tax=Pholiota conissans TaxID=109636 RepID=A0A9P5YTY0_9AGAR|nr:hypothetical protein BDN70DRAFT_883769 [Pholiota conissans]